MVGQHHQLNRCESEQTPGDGEPERTGKLGMLLSVGLQRVGEDLATKQLQQRKEVTQIKVSFCHFVFNLTKYGICL